MRILLVEPYVPYPLDRGTYHRVFNLARELGQRHTVDFFALNADDSAKHRPVFEAFCRRVHFQPFVHPPWKPFFPDRILSAEPTTISHWTCANAFRAFEEFTRGQSYDLINFYDLVMWQYARTLPLGPVRVMDRSRVDLLFQSAELTHLKLGFKERLMRQENLWKLRRYEKSTAAQLDATVVCGPDDETFLRQEVPEAHEIKVLANGVDVDFFNRDLFPPTPDPAPTILFCGAMDYSPNVNGLAWYFDNVDALVREKVPDRKVLIVGKNPLPCVQALAEIPGVAVTGGVPDVRPYYQRAWLQMVPLLIGGGTRLKIVESLSLGTPVVSTTIGAQGLVLEDELHILLADTPSRFAEALVRVLKTESLRTQLSEQGRARVLERYSWPKLGGELSEYLVNLVENHDRRSA